MDVGRAVIKPQQFLGPDPMFSVQSWIFAELGMRQLFASCIEFEGYLRKAPTRKNSDPHRRTNALAPAIRLIIDTVFMPARKSQNLGFAPKNPKPFLCTAHCLFSITNL